MPAIDVPDVSVTPPTAAMQQNGSQMPVGRVIDTFDGDTAPPHDSDSDSSCDPHGIHDANGFGSNGFNGFDGG